MKKEQNIYPKSCRLLSPKQFKQVFDNTDKKIHGSHLLLFVRKNEYNHARLGLAITKKKVPTAVARNHLKRLVRENFRTKLSEFKNLDMVFIVKRPIHQLSNEDLTKQINDCLQKCKK